MLALALAALLAGAAPTSSAEPLGISLESLPYPHPVQLLPLPIEGQDLRMAYMDVAPSGPPNGKAVVLLHGKNFPGAYWTGTIRALSRRPGTLLSHLFRDVAGGVRDVGRGGLAPDARTRVAARRPRLGPHLRDVLHAAGGPGSREDQGAGVARHRAGRPHHARPRLPFTQRY